MNTDNRTQRVKNYSDCQSNLNLKPSEKYKLLLPPLPLRNGGLTYRVHPGESFINSNPVPSKYVQEICKLIRDREPEYLPKSKSHCHNVIAVSQLTPRRFQSPPLPPPIAFDAGARATKTLLRRNPSSFENERDEHKLCKFFDKLIRSQQNSNFKGSGLESDARQSDTALSSSVGVKVNATRRRRKKLSLSELQRIQSQQQQESLRSKRWNCSPKVPDPRLPDQDQSIDQHNQNSSFRNPEVSHCHSNETGNKRNDQYDHATSVPTSKRFQGKSHDSGPVNSQSRHHEYQRHVPYPTEPESVSPQPGPGEHSKPRATRVPQPEESPRVPIDTRQCQHHHETEVQHGQSEAQSSSQCPLNNLNSGRPQCAYNQPIYILQSPTSNLASPVPSYQQSQQPVVFVQSRNLQRASSYSLPSPTPSQPFFLQQMPIVSPSFQQFSPNQPAFVQNISQIQQQHQQLIQQSEQAQLTLKTTRVAAVQVPYPANVNDAFPFCNIQHRPMDDTVCNNCGACSPARDPAPIQPQSQLMKQPAIQFIVGPSPAESLGNFGSTRVVCTASDPGIQSQWSRQNDPNFNHNETSESGAQSESKIQKAHLGCDGKGATNRKRWTVRQTEKLGIDPSHRAETSSKCNQNSDSDLATPTTSKQTVVIRRHDERDPSPPPDTSSDSSSSIPAQRRSKVFRKNLKSHPNYDQAHSQYGDHLQTTSNGDSSLNLVDAVKSLEEGVHLMQDPEWEKNICGLKVVVFHSKSNEERVSDHLHVIVPIVQGHLRSSSSKLCRQSIICLKKLFRTLGPHFDPYLLNIAECLFSKMANTNKFIKEECEATLETMVRYCSQPKMIQILETISRRHKQVSIQTVACKMVTVFINSVGPEEALIEYPNYILPLLCSHLGDRAAELRDEAKHALRLLIPVPRFDSYLREYVSPQHIFGICDKLERIKDEVLERAPRKRREARCHNKWQRYYE